MRFQMQLDSQSQAPTLSGHPERCPACRQYAQRLLRLHEQLRAPAAEPAITDPRIERIQAVVMQELAIGAPAKRLLFPRLAVPAAAAVILLVLGLWSLLTPPAPPPPGPASQPRAALTLDTSAIRAPVTRALALPEASLGRELQLLATDTRQALTYLRNCLPTPPASAGTDQGN